MYITQGLHRHLQQRPNAVAIRSQGRKHHAMPNSVTGLRAWPVRSRAWASPAAIAWRCFRSTRSAFIEYYLAVPWADAVVNPVNFRWSAGGDRLLAGRLAKPRC